MPDQVDKIIVFPRPALHGRIVAEMISVHPDGKILMASEKNIPEARDADKLIRQLSLVAFLMSRRGRPAGAEAIRLKVEGYGGDEQRWDSFVRRFHADREELARLGIVIEHERDPDGEGDIYWLPPQNYFLPAVSFSRQELAALGACLGLLDGQFAYSRALKLALLGLALGTGNELADPAAPDISVSLQSPAYDDTIARRQRDIEKALSQRKTIQYAYLALGRKKVQQRTVDPYGMMLTRGDWYLIGHSHERDAVRVFKLARIQGKISMLSKYPNSYEIPTDFRAADYTSLEPWQLGDIQGEAVLDFSPRLGWWAEANLGHAGRLEVHDDDSATLVTGYNDARPLMQLAMRLHPDATLRGPEELRFQMRDALEAIAADHRGEAPALAGPAKKRSDLGGRAGGEAAITQQVPPERFALMATAISYFVDQLEGRDEVILPADEVMQDLGFEDRRSLSQALSLIGLINFGGEAYVVWPQLKGDSVHVERYPESDSFRKPAHLSPREARALLLAIDLVGSHLLAGQFPSLESARAKIMQAAGGLDESQAIAVGATEREDYQICQAVNQALRDRRLVEIRYLSGDGAGLQSRCIEPYLVTRGGGTWYLAAWCRLREGMRTFRFDRIRSARMLKDRFEPRDPGSLDLERYREDPSGRKSASLAEIWFAPEAALLKTEEKDDVTPLKDGSLVARIPYFSEKWLVAEVLGHGGQAILMSPAGMRELVAAAAAAAAASYK